MRWSLYSRRRRSISPSASRAAIAPDNFIGTTSCLARASGWKSKRADHGTHREIRNPNEEIRSVLRSRIECNRVFGSGGRCRNTCDFDVKTADGGIKTEARNRKANESEGLLVSGLVWNLEFGFRISPVTVIATMFG